VIRPTSSAAGEWRIQSSNTGSCATTFSAIVPPTTTPPLAFDTLSGFCGAGANSRSSG